MAHRVAVAAAVLDDGHLVAVAARVQRGRVDADVCQRAAHEHLRHEAAVQQLHQPLVLRRERAVVRLGEDDVAPGHHGRLHLRRELGAAAALAHARLLVRARADAQERLLVRLHGRLLVRARRRLAPPRRRLLGAQRLRRHDLLALGLQRPVVLELAAHPHHVPRARVAEGLDETQRAVDEAFGLARVQRAVGRQEVILQVQHQERLPRLHDRQRVWADVDGERRPHGGLLPVAGASVSSGRRQGIGTWGWFEVRRRSRLEAIVSTCLRLDLPRLRGWLFVNETHCERAAANPCWRYRLGTEPLWFGATGFGT